MKKAKISAKGVVQHVWPWVKTLPDGTQVTKDIPPHYLAKPFACIVDVPDNVKVGFVWNGSEYAPAVKKKPVYHGDTVLEVICEKLGVTLESVINEAQERKQRRAISSKRA